MTELVDQLRREQEKAMVERLHAPDLAGRTYWAGLARGLERAREIIDEQQPVPEQSGEVCRVCGEPMSDRYCHEQAHWWHDEGCPNRGSVEWNLGCDCSGWVHPHCCPCDLPHEVEP